MFDVLVYLYENYDRAEACPERPTLRRKLSAVGFDRDEIRDALAWLDGLDRAADGRAIAAPQSAIARRVYDAEEIERLGADPVAFLVFLESAGVLPPSMREMVVDRANAAGHAPLALEQLKVIVLMVFWRLGKEPDALILDELFVAPEERIVH